MGIIVIVAVGFLLGVFVGWVTPRLLSQDCPTYGCQEGSTCPRTGRACPKEWSPIARNLSD